MGRLAYPAQTITGHVAPTLDDPDREIGPILGIDECMNNGEYIGALATRLVSQGVVLASIPLWYQRRKMSDGSHSIVAGSHIRATAALPDVGRALRGELAKWPDDLVIQQLVAYFTKYDHIIFLTKDQHKNAEGVRHIFNHEVAPALAALPVQRLCLQVYTPSAGTTLRLFAEAVEKSIRREQPTPGLSWRCL